VALDLYFSFFNCYLDDVSKPFESTQGCDIIYTATTATGPELSRSSNRRVHILAGKYLMCVSAQTAQRAPE